MGDAAGRGGGHEDLDREAPRGLTELGRLASSATNEDLQ